MRKPQGYAILTGPNSVQEWDTRTCAHCNRVDHIEPMCDPADMGGLCGVCAGLICQDCVGKGCDPLEEKLKREEASYHARRSYG